jgi:hypothetical protein
MVSERPIPTIVIEAMAEVIARIVSRGVRDAPLLVEIGPEFITL